MLLELFAAQGIVDQFFLDDFLFSCYLSCFHDQFVWRSGNVKFMKCCSLVMVVVLIMLFVLLFMV